MWIEIILGIVGLYLLIRGSDWVTDAAIPLAKSLNTTRVAVGLVLVSFLLSLPELFVAISSVIKGHPQLGVGVSIGSIIVNLGLIIGFSAIIRPIHIPRHVITRDLVFMSVITIVVFLLALQNLELTRNDGFVLLLLFVPYLINVYEQERSLAGREREKEAESLATTLYRVGKVDNPPFFWNEKIMFLIGALLLLVGSELFTNSLISLAQIMRVPDLLIGLTLGAIGPSIPNMAAAWQAVRRGNDELAISETIGSNIFTLLITLGLVAIVQPLKLDASVAQITIPAVVLITGLFLFFSLKGRISRKEGFILFGAYLTILIFELLLRTG